MIDWQAPAKLVERNDSGSERDYDFQERGTGALGVLVGQVSAMSAHERARMLIDAGTLGTFNVGQIVEMSQRPDFPG